MSEPDRAELPPFALPTLPRGGGHVTDSVVKRPLTKRMKAQIQKAVERPDWGLRLIVCFKLAKAITLIGCSILAFYLAPKTDLRSALEAIVSWFHINPANEHVERVLLKLVNVHPKTLREIGAGAMVFAVFILVEAWGLHNRRVWAEWLTIVATTLLIPVELFELYEKKSLGKLFALVVNIAVVIYLARHRFLFIPGPIGRWLNDTFGSPEPAAKP